MEIINQNYKQLLMWWRKINTKRNGTQMTQIKLICADK